MKAATRPWWRRHARPLCLAAAALCFAAAAADPQIGIRRKVGTHLFVFDITQSMNVRDGRWNGQPVTRLEQARALAGAVLERLPCGSQVGIGLFVERQTRPLLAPLEVCAHRPALDDLLQHLDWRMAWGAESHIEYGVIDALAAIRRDLPGTGLVFFTDGDQAPPAFDDDALRTAARQSAVPGVLLGLGGIRPQPVPRLGAHGRVEGYWTDHSGLDDPDARGPIKLDKNIEGHLGYLRNSMEQPQEQKPPDKMELSWRHDAVLQKVAVALGLRLAVAPSPAQLARELEQLGSRPALSRVGLGDAFALTGLALLLASLLPAGAARLRPLRLHRLPAQRAAAAR